MGNPQTRIWILRIIGFSLFAFTGYIVYSSTQGDRPRNFWSFRKTPQSDIYAVPGKWIDQNGKTVELKDFRGRLSVAAFVYLKCQAVCPVIMSDVRKIEEAVAQQKKGGPEFLIFLFDDARQNPGDVQEFLKNYKISGASWHILTADAGTLRSMADVFDLKYDVVDQAKLAYAHTNLIAIIGPDGKVRKADYGLTEETTKMAARITAEQ